MKLFRNRSIHLDLVERVIFSKCHKNEKKARHGVGKLFQFQKSDYEKNTPNLPFSPLPLNFDLLLFDIVDVRQSIHVLWFYRCFVFLIFQLKSLPLYARWISDSCQFAQQLMSTETIYWLYKGIQKKIHLMYCQKGTTLLPPEKKGLIIFFFFILNILYLTYPKFLNNFEKMSICCLGRLNE